jgi:integrase/recombinase XerD
MTGLARQAKTLTSTQLNSLLRLVQSKRSPDRNTVLVLLSFKAGLRSKEIGCLRWEMLTDAEGNLRDCLSLVNEASKGRSGRVIPLHPQLHAALQTHYEREKQARRGSPSDYVLWFAKGSDDAKTRANTVQCLFRQWYRSLGWKGVSSHSGRRTFITAAARKVSAVGGSLRDVQALAGHASIQVTQRYVDTDPEAQRKLVALL